MAMSSGGVGLLGSAAALLGSPVAGTSMRGHTNVAMWSCPLPPSFHHCGLRKHSSSLSSPPPSPPFVMAVAATDSSNQVSPTQQPSDSKSSKYHFGVANAKFMLEEEEHFQELLFERLRNYGDRNKEQDFWLVIEPKFLDNFPNITKRLRRPAVARLHQRYLDHVSAFSTLNCETHAFLGFCLVMLSRPTIRKP
ncbi:uncharacterized protein LOC115731510 [Rhodamnia argentea]|uniref:Uncharacterized protein LOC115731510 n=1 Tax=Rhodamnia argentea TaxID=178133 RepID=A0ABM3HD25_9MYRT|nr:uncharacterized protein LOC115731510 [Rhodamnia argentea]